MTYRAMPSGSNGRATYRPRARLLALDLEYERVRVDDKLLWLEPAQDLEPMLQDFVSQMRDCARLDRRARHERGL
jgi:hypothetical protein